ncbi:hypothetical protein GCM10010428_27740 [Actinosynnema pretiosum subsp. pretiosum]
MVALPGLVYGDHALELLRAVLGERAGPVTDPLTWATSGSAAGLRANGGPPRPGLATPVRRRGPGLDAGARNVGAAGSDRFHGRRRGPAGRDHPPLPERATTAEVIRITTEKRASDRPADDRVVER